MKNMFTILGITASSNNSNQIGHNDSSGVVKEMKDTIPESTKASESAFLILPTRDFRGSFVLIILDWQACADDPSAALNCIIFDAWFQVATRVQLQKSLQKSRRVMLVMPTSFHYPLAAQDEEVEAIDYLLSFEEFLE